MRTEKTDEMLAELLDRARPIYGDESRERALSAMARSYAEPMQHRGTHRGSWVVRAAVVAVVVALGLGFLVVPSRFGKPDANAILADVAHAMADADSVLWFCELTGAGLAMSERCDAELLHKGSETYYSGPRTAYTRRTQADGMISWAEGVNLDTLQWWLYERQPRTDEGVLYVADLAPVKAEVADYLSRPDENRLHDWPFAYRLHAWPWALASGLDEREVEVTSASFDGHQVTVVTYTGWQPVTVGEGKTSSHEPRLVRARNVLEVDAETDRLLNAYFYWQFEDEPEQLVARWRVEYDAPMPTLLAQPPDASRIVEATVGVDETIESGYQVTRLSMWVGDRQITALGARNDRSSQTFPDTKSALEAVRPELDQVTKNMTNLNLALQMYLADNGDVLPPVDNVRDLMPVLDRYLRSRTVFMRPGTEDEVIVEYLVPPGFNWREIGDFAGTPVAVANYHPDFAVFAYADGHVGTADKHDPAYQDGWWEDWWRQLEVRRARGH